MSYKELMNECDMLKGNINRMMVTKDPKELLRMYEFAEQRLQKIHKARVAELDETEKEERLDLLGQQS